MHFFKVWYNLNCQFLKKKNLFPVIKLEDIDQNPNRLGGVMVKASASRAEGRGSIPGRVMPKTLKMEF